MLNESFIVSIVILVLCGAACVYLYYCNAYLEKKVSFMESILIDLRMTLDTLLTEDSTAQKQGAVPISSVLPPKDAASPFTAPEPLEGDEMEQLPEDKFYSSVLEQAHQEAEEGGADSEGSGMAGIPPPPKIDITDDDETSQPQQPSRIGANYDGMTRNELFTLAEQRGLRARKSSSRAELISLLRRADSLQIDGSSAGTEKTDAAAAAAPEPAGTLFPSTGALDGSFPVDLGQSGEPVEGI